MSSEETFVLFYKNLFCTEVKVTRNETNNLFATVNIYSDDQRRALTTILPKEYLK